VRRLLYSVFSSTWVLVIAGPVILPEQMCFGSDPDPVVLLQGVEEARLQIPPSRLHLQLLYTNSVGPGMQDVEIEFDREKRRYIQNDSKDRQLFNGSNCISFMGSSQVNIRDLGGPDINYLFDPRLLGITTTYMPKGTIEKAVRYRNAKKVELVGPEQVQGKSAWHVRVIDEYDQQDDFWIDPDRDFAVYRSDTAIGSQINSTRSYYDEKIYKWLPSRVETVYRIGPDGPITSGRVITILHAEVPVKLPDSTWTIAGVQPSIGTPVFDVRRNVLMGYWNGTSLSRTPVTPSEVVAAPSKLLMVLLALLLVCPLLIWKFRSPSPRPNG
jgi:hypothetical protein